MVALILPFSLPKKNMKIIRRYTALLTAIIAAAMIALVLVINHHAMKMITTQELEGMRAPLSLPNVLPRETGGGLNGSSNVRYCYLRLAVSAWFGKILLQLLLKIFT
jgi:hypothetical protein